MRILIAEDNRAARCALELHLAQWGYDVVSTADGAAAWGAFQEPGAPRLAVLDWMMPGLDGVEICRRVRGLGDEQPIYLILLTARHTTIDVVTGLYAGANDYIAKPFQRDELRARVDVGVRVVQ